MEAGQRGLSGPTVHLNVTPVIKFESDFATRLLLCTVAANARGRTFRPETVTPAPAQVPPLLHLPPRCKQMCMNVFAPSGACPRGMMFMTAAECEGQGGACPRVCLDMTVSEVQCATSCYDGCYCAPGFYLLNRSCVPLSQCPCYHQGELYNANTTFPVDACNNWYCLILQWDIKNLYGIYILNWIFVSKIARVLMVKWSVAHLPALVSNRHQDDSCWLVFDSASICGP